MEFILSVVSYVAKELPNWVGFLLPFLVQVLNLRVHREVERYTISVFVCIFVAAVIHWHDIAFGNTKMAIMSMALLFAESNTFYTLYFSRSGMRSGLISILGGTPNLEEPLEKVQPQNV